MKKAPHEKAAAKMESIRTSRSQRSMVQGSLVECFNRPVRSAPYVRTYWQVNGIRTSKLDVLAFLTELYTKE